MNYIRKLKNDNKELSAELIGLKAILQNIKEHLALNKFEWPNDYIQVNDILGIIEQGQWLTNDLVNDQIRVNRELDHKKEERT